MDGGGKGSGGSSTWRRSRAGELKRRSLISHYQTQAAGLRRPAGFAGLGGIQAYLQAANNIGDPQDLLRSVTNVNDYHEKLRNPLVQDIKSRGVQKRHRSAVNVAFASGANPLRGGHDGKLAGAYSFERPTLNQRLSEPPDFKHINKKAGGIIGSFKKGGKVKRTGKYKLHKGEVVVPADRVKKCAKKR